jgi:hypothetical protein
MAEAYEPDLRRLLRSAERFSERAMLRGSLRENTPRSSVSASLVCVTRCDQRLRVRAAISLATTRRRQSFRCVRKR